MHAAVDVGDAPGWATWPVSCRGKNRPLVLVEGLQWRVLARTLQLVPIETNARVGLLFQTRKFIQKKKKNLQMQKLTSEMSRLIIIQQHLFLNCSAESCGDGDITQTQHTNRA